MSDTNDLVPQLTAFGEKMRRLEALSAEPREDCAELPSSAETAPSVPHLEAVLRDLDAFHKKFAKERERADAAEAKMRESMDALTDARHLAFKEESAEELRAAARDLLGEIARRAGPAAAPAKADAERLPASMLEAVAGADADSAGKRGA